MSKTKKITTKQNKDLEKKVMSKITKGEIVIKPRWYFLLGSLLSVLGIVGVIFGAIFLLNLFFFLIRKHGPGFLKLQLMISDFPWWIPTSALILIIAGIWLLKKYDFSYKKNFLLIVLVFIVSILFAAFLIDSPGINENWSKHRFGRRFYQRFDHPETPNIITPPGRGRHFRFNKN